MSGKKLHGSWSCPALSDNVHMFELDLDRLWAILDLELHHQFLLGDIVADDAVETIDDYCCVKGCSMGEDD